MTASHTMPGPLRRGERLLIALAVSLSLLFVAAPMVFIFARACHAGGMSISPISCTR